MSRRRKGRGTSVPQPDLPVEPEYEIRFIRREHVADLVNRYHTARTALADKPLDRRTPYDRMLWASKSFADDHGYVSATGAYKDLCGLLGR